MLFEHYPYISLREKGDENQSNCHQKEKMFDLSSILPTNNSRKCMEISEENLYVDIGA